MNKKAFTLIELLAVIVVIGIIAVIAIPRIIDVITNTRKSAFEASAREVAKQIKNDLTSGDIDGNQVNCLNEYYGLKDKNYESCTANIYYGDEDDIISVDLVGKGSYAGYTVIGATDGEAHIIENKDAQSLKTVLIATVGEKDIAVNKFAGSGLYKWGNKYIYRGGITITNSSGVLTNDQYASDSYNKATDPANYIKVPWENNALACESAGVTYYTSSPCWRIISINSDGSMTIVRDQKLTTDQMFDGTHNTEASDTYGQPTVHHGYNDLLENVPTTEHPEEYRQYSQMYTRLYGDSGYQNSTLKNYYYLLQPINVCLNKVNEYVGINLSSYASSNYGKDTCNITGAINTSAVNPLKNKYVRLPYIEEYLNTSLESVSICTDEYQYQCRSQNFMYNKQTYWAINGRISSSWLVRIVSVYGRTSNGSAGYSYSVRPVVTLNRSVLISGGLGTVENPYILKQQ